MHNIAIKGVGLLITSIGVVVIVLLNIGTSLRVLEVLVLNLGKSNHLE
jgi:hypothetical protein